MNRKFGFLKFACAAGALCHATGAFAQDAGGARAGAQQETSALDTIVVTARKREESLQDVPVAVSAISQDQLTANVATDLSKVAELAPQVMIGRYITGSGAVITIRGISALPSDSGFDQSVSLSIDGVNVSRGRIIGATVFDMQQVEILQGPQALFFGKNSPAGVISMRSVNPTDEFEGYVRGGYEFTAEEKFLEAAISGPVAPNLKARLAVRGNWMKGWIRNNARPVADPFNPSVTLPGATAGRTSPDGHDYAGRFTLLWTPAEDFDANFKLTLNEQRSNSGSAQAEAFCIGATTTPTQLGIPLPFSDCAIDRNKAESSASPIYAADHPYGNNGVPYMKSSFALASLTLNKTFGDVTVTSTTGYYDQSVSDSYTADFTEFTHLYVAEHEEYSLLTQELRLDTDFSSPFNFMTGLYFEKSDRKWQNAPNIFNVYDPVADNYLTNLQRSKSDNHTFSAFAQLRWNITPELELSGGARYTYDVRKSALVNIQNNQESSIGRGLYPQGQVLKSRYKNEDVSPEATLTWHPQADQTLYAAYKTGYKSGGISNAALLPANATPDSVQVGPEQAEGFEAGYKADLFGRKLRMALTAYTYKYKGLQVVFSDTQAFRYIVGNAAASRTKGVLGSFTWLATDNLSVNGGVGFNRARYISFPGAQCYSGQSEAQGCVGGVQDLGGKALPRAPKWTFNLGGDYRAELPGWFVDLSATGAYSSSYQTAADYGAGGYQDSYWRLNAAIHLSPESERFRLSLIGRNLTNTYYKVATFSHPASGNPDQFVSIFNRPREVLVQAEYKF